jgi:hypothetical protein
MMLSDSSRRALRSIEWRKYHTHATPVIPRYRATKKVAAVTESAITLPPEMTLIPT